MQPAEPSPSIPEPAALAGARVNVLDCDRAGLGRLLGDLGEKPWRSTQIMRWVYHERHAAYGGMTNIGKVLRGKLESATEIRAPEVVLDHLSADGTRKWVMQVDAGNRVETVFIPEPDRGTLCVSSQVGCAMACGFCATATQGFSRNLSTAEIIGQVWRAAEALEHHPHDNRRITNVVMMGMGEPLMNFDNVVRAMDLMMDDCAYGLARKRVTLSTAGIVPAIDRLREVSGVSLAVSLHATDDALRDRLMPINRTYPIAELLAACRRYATLDPHRSITFEYVMLDGVNDSPAHARALARLLRGMPAKVNLIPFNPFAGAGFRRSPQPVIDAFREVLRALGLICITRRTRGDDIDAACGQLVGKVMARAARHRADAVPRDVPLAAAFPEVHAG
ncbi:MAG TPA: 23S rRNA (adenine(2503)-C(2))-methyltransferase RlmN [Gammaproteobacteria bacterium]|nr:23S rRNA (adenine(2503)-C(2))-methyltransferase RlmN [Gammaproteobacteria bacterium]